MPDSAALPIGVFDSGVGGLTVLHAIRDLLPAEDLLYLGDTARLPYGTKSPRSVQRYAAHAADFLVNRGIKLLVVACNTASAVALEQLRLQLAPMPVIGVVEPGAAAAVAGSERQHHLVLATEATTARGAYTAAIKALRSGARVEELPCSMFVALAEEGWHTGAAAEIVARTYFGPVVGRPVGEQPDTAILGCTHFPLLREVIGAALGPDIRIIDSATTAAEAVRDALAARGALNSAGGNLQLVATDGAERFARIGSAFLGSPFAAEDIEIADIHPIEVG